MTIHANYVYLSLSSFLYTIHSVFVAEYIGIIMAQLEGPDYFLISNGKSYNKRKSRMFWHMHPVGFSQKSPPLELHYSEYTGIHY